MKYVLFFPFILLFFLSIPSQAQTTKADSLEAAIQQTEEGIPKVDLLNQVAHLYAPVQPKLSEERGQTALDLAIQLSYKKGEALARGVLGFAAMYQGNFPAAIKESEQALAMAEAGDWPELRIGLNRTLGSVYFFMGRYQEGLAYSQTSLDLATSYGDTLNMAKTNMNIASLYTQKGEFEKALKYYEISEELFRPFDIEEYHRKIALNLGTLYIQQGNVEKGLEYFLDLKSRYDEKIPSVELGTVYATLGTAYQMQGDNEQTVYYLNKALDIYQRFGEERLLAGYTANLALVYIEMDSLDRAIERLNGSLALALKNKDDRSAAKIYEAIGVCYRDLGEYEKALEHMYVALEHMTDVEEPAWWASIYNHLASVYDILEKHDKVLEMLEKAKEYLALYRDDRLYGTLLCNIGRTHYWLRDYEKAHTYFLESIALFEGIYESLTGEASKQKFLFEGSDSYERAFATSLFLDSIPEAFLYAEKLKSRILNELIAEAEIDITLSPELEQERKEIREGLQHIDQVLQQDLRESVKTELLNEKQLLTSQLKIFQGKVRELEPVAANLIYPKQATLSEIQSMLHKNEALIEYVARVDITAAIIVTADSYQAVVLDTNWQVSTAVWEFREEYLEENRKAIHNKNFQENADQAFFETSNQLYELLFAPLEKTGLLKGKDLIIIPDRRLNYLPFELLIRDQERKPYVAYDYLIRDYEIQYSPSATTFFQQRNKVNRPKTYEKQLLAFGDPVFQPSRTAIAEYSLNEEQEIRDALQPLVHASRELEGIAELFPKEEVELLTQGNATEDTLKCMDLSNFRYLHFSTHGIINSQYPDWSAIALSQDADPREDGLLQMYEMFDLRLQADLVTLSACETGLGKLVEGEGMVGFARSLMYAGTPSLILSLWSVADESTADLFLSYYQTLKRIKGKDKLRPLRKAQLQMIRAGGDFANPYYWAPFILIGER